VRAACLPVLVLALACGSSAARGPCEPQPGPGRLGTICGFANPEDVEAVPAARLLLVSEMRPLVGHGTGGGLIAALTGPDARPRTLFPPGVPANAPPAGDPSCTAPPPADRFAPHGLTAAPGPTPGITRVAVVGHRFREAIELFDLQGEGDAATLAWRGCVPLPSGAVGNDVAIAPDGELVVTNFQPSMTGVWLLYYNVLAGLGLNTGDVLGWLPERGWRRIPGSEARTPNGIAVSRDGTTVFFAEAAAGRVVALPRAGGTPRRVSVVGDPDNLAWTTHGTLLAGSHIPGTRMLACLLGRTPCRSAWALVEIDPTTLRSREVFHHDGDAVGAVASAAEFGDCMYFGSVFDDRIGVLCPPPDQEGR
jgi:hypothetical protein